MDQDTGRQSGSDHLAVFGAVSCLATSTLALELLQTRILSALYFNHVVYLTVTVALLGFGISGVFVSMAGQRVRQPLRLAAQAIGGFAVLTPVCLMAASWSPVLVPTWSVIPKLIFCYAVLTLPFVCSGAALGAIFMSHGSRIYRLYFADLTASAVGILAFAWLLQPLGAENLAWGLTGVALVGFWLLGHRTGLSLRQLVGPTAFLGVCFCALATRLIHEQPDWYKSGGSDELLATPDLQSERSLWTTIAKIDVMTSQHLHVDVGRQPEPVRYKKITQDRDAFTMLPSPAFVQRVQAEVARGEILWPHNLGYVIRPRPKDTLIIGVGGGADVVAARAFGSERITGVEINPATIGLVTRTYREEAVWPTWDNVEMICADGRNYVAGTDRQFDLIILAGIDTFSALSTGAYVLAENYLYTVEAMADYRARLKPGGVLVIYRWLFQHPRESLRLANLFCEAARRHGFGDPARQVMIVGTDLNSSYRWAASLFKNGEFTADEVRAVLRHVAAHHRDRRPAGASMAAVYLPQVFAAEEQRALEHQYFQEDADYLTPTRAAFAGLLAAGSAEQRRAFEQAYYYNIAPVSDDRPFFFQYHKFTEALTVADLNGFGLRGVMVHYTLYILLAVTTLVVLGAMLAPLSYFERDGLRVHGAPALLLFFAALGLGFMFIELGAIQIFAVYLGHPVYALSVVVAGLLLFTGLGSYLCSLRRCEPGRLLREGMLGTVAAALVWLWLTGPLIGRTRGYADGTRVALALVSLLPLGVFMGMPFATGLRLLEVQCPRLIPWAWGVNGTTSVLASILAIILAMHLGFRAVILGGVVCYSVGYLVAWRYLRPSVSSTSAGGAERSV